MDIFVVMIVCSLCFSCLLVLQFNAFIAILVDFLLSLFNNLEIFAYLDFLPPSWLDICCILPQYIQASIPNLVPVFLVCLAIQVCNQYISFVFLSVLIFNNHLSVF